MLHFRNGKPSTPDGLSLRANKCVSASESGSSSNKLLHDFLLRDDLDLPLDLDAKSELQNSHWAVRRRLHPAFCEGARWEARAE